MDEKFTVSYHYNGNHYSADFETIQEAVRFAAANITEEFAPDIYDVNTGERWGWVDTDGYHIYTYSDDDEDADGWDEDPWNELHWNEDYAMGYDPYTGCFSDDC